MSDHRTLYSFGCPENDPHCDGRMVTPPIGEFHPYPCPHGTASAHLDWRRAWELAAPVVVAARRYALAEAEGHMGLIHDAHLQLLRALTDYFDGGPPGESPLEAVRRHLWIADPAARLDGSSE